MVALTMRILSDFLGNYRFYSLRGPKTLRSLGSRPAGGSLPGAEM